MIMQMVKFETTLTEDEIWAMAKERLPRFQALPGLVQKYYVKLSGSNRYGGVYLWDSMESLKEFRESELAATIPQAYKVVGQPEIEIMEVVFPLRG